MKGWHFIAIFIAKFFQKVEISKPFAKILKDIRKILGKRQKNSRENSNSRKKLKTQGNKNSMSRRIAPLLTSQVMLKKKPALASKTFPLRGKQIEIPPDEQGFFYCHNDLELLVHYRCNYFEHFILGKKI